MAVHIFSIIFMTVINLACSLQILTPMGNANQAITAGTVDELCQAVLENNVAKVNKIITDKSVSLNAKDSGGNYPLEMVLPMENCEMARILLAAGADPYAVGKEGVSIYDIVMKGSNKTLKEIFKAHKRG